MAKLGDIYVQTHVDVVLKARISFWDALKLRLSGKEAYQKLINLIESK